MFHRRALWLFKKCDTNKMDDHDHRHLIELDALWGAAPRDLALRLTPSRRNEVLAHYINRSLLNSSFILT